MMKISLVKSGPMSVSFEVYPDFMHYSGGVYHHSHLVDKFNPFEVTAAVVVVVVVVVRARTCSTVVHIYYYYYQVIIYGFIIKNY